MAIDATVGSPTMNSYVTAAEAAAYFAQRLNATAWAANASKQEPGLVQARRRLDAESYLGQRVSPTQTCAWPRDNETDPITGEDLVGTTVPSSVKDAQCEMWLALVAADGDLFADTGMEAFSQVTVGPLAVTLRDDTLASDLPIMVERLLAPYLISSGGSFRLVRG